MATQFLNICEIIDVRAFVTCTLRTNEEQEELFAQGRTKPGKIITNARAGQSKHNPGPDGLARAFDVAFRCGDKGATWDGPWDTLGKVADLVGLRWGGNWHGFKDYPHFEL